VGAENVAHVTSDEVSSGMEAAGAEPNTRHVISDEVSSEMKAEASISGGPDGSQMTESPQAVGGGTSEEEDGSSQGRPQRTTQAPKRLTYDTPGNPVYVREMNIRPPSGTSQFWIPPPVPCMPEPPLNQYRTLPPATPCLIPPAVPMMFWSANTMMPYTVPCPAPPHFPQWGVPYQSFPCR